MNQTDTYVNGNPFARFGAKMLDELVCIALLYPFMKLYGNSPFTVIMLFVVPVAYHTYMHASSLQATAGEYVLKLMVIRDNGARLSLRRSLERSLAYAMPSLPAYASLSDETTMSLVLFLAILWYFPILLTQRAVGVHDMLCGTRVVAGRT